nr:phospholipase-like protein [Tanacetum cinerariifolium]
QLPTSTRRRSKRHIQEVVSAADNGEVVKETQLLDSHEVVELWVQLMWHLRPKHADWDISSPYYYNLPTPNDLEDWILKDITYPVGWANVEMVYIPENILGIHWFLAVFKIRNAVVTFYDTLNNKKNLRTRMTVLGGSNFRTDEQTTMEGHVKGWCLQ